LYELKKNFSTSTGALQIEQVQSLRKNITPTFRAFHQQLILEDAKASLCHTFDSAFDVESNAQMPTVEYELPDGRSIKLGPERYSIPDLLFDPNSSLLPSKNTTTTTTTTKNTTTTTSENTNKTLTKDLGIHQLVHKVIESCDVDMRRELYANLILCGGTSLLKGFSERLTTELVASGPPQRMKIVNASNAMVERKFATWIGGSILASLGSFQQLWVSAQEYDEFGADIVCKKCP